jgi:two-component system response regulator HydG
VRELQHFLEQAVVVTTGPELSCKDMVALGSEPAVHNLRTIARGATRQTERARIRLALQHANGNLARTAKLLKISRASLYNKIIGLVQSDRLEQRDGPAHSVALRHCGN